jgi:uncharacterized membrane protein
MVDRPIENVWGMVSDAEAWPRFLAWVARWEPVVGAAPGLGARYDVRLQVGAAEVGGVVEVVEWSPPHAIAWRGLTGLNEHGRIELRERGRRTDVKMTLTYRVPGPFGRAAAVAAAPFAMFQMRRSLAALRALAEGASQTSS